jgi:hypothetical protein
MPSADHNSSRALNMSSSLVWHSVKCWLVECQALSIDKHSTKTGCRQNTVNRPRQLTSVKYVERLSLALEKWIVCRVSFYDTQQSVFVFFFQTFFHYVTTILGTTFAILAHFSKRLIYLLNLFNLMEFLCIIQIWTASHSYNKNNECKNNIRVIEHMLRPYPGTN